MKIGRTFTVLNSKETKLLMQQLNKQFDTTEDLEYVFIKNNKEKVYLISREIEKISLDKIRIDSLGLYFGTIQPDGFRPSIEGSQIIGKIARRNILEINNDQKHEWIKGNNLEVEKEGNEIVLLKYNKDFMGAGKHRGHTIINSISKARRLVNVNETLEEENIVEKIK
jgi:NOL1/NOP2/fmu family ribosome biogenesis protein